MNLDKAQHRDRKRSQRNKMGRCGDSVKTIQRLQQKRRDEIMKRKREEKEHERDSG